MTTQQIIEEQIKQAKEKQICFCDLCADIHGGKNTDLLLSSYAKVAESARLEISTKKKWIPVNCKIDCSSDVLNIILPKP